MMFAPTSKALLAAFTILLCLGFSALAQADLPKESAPTPHLSQQERAEMAMQKSLARQQAALDALRAANPSSALKHQESSILRQVSGVKSSPSATPAITERATDKNSSNVITSKSFFSLPWPSSVPLAAPNVLMMDQPCDALPRDQVDKLVETSSVREGIDPSLLRSVMRQESAFKPCAVSVAGAMGLMQIMPGTADMLGLDDPYDPAKNTAAGAKYLKMMLDRYQGDVPMALGAYNAGPGRVDKASGVPPISETIQYVTNILRSLPLN